MAKNFQGVVLGWLRQLQATVQGATVVSAVNATVPVALGGTGTIVSNAGATAARVFSLPPAKKGMRVTALVQAAFALRLDPNGTETIALPSTGVQGAAGKYLEADAVGERVVLIVLENGKWQVESFNGTWTAEA